MAPRPPSADRARRLLALLPLLAASPRASLASLATATGEDIASVADDLGLLSICGYDAADPLALVPVLVEGGSVVTFGDIPALDAPVRLTVAEASAVIAALQACGVDPTGALAERLASVSSEALDVDAIARVVRSSAAPGGLAHTHAALTAAAAAGRAVAFDYTPLGDNEPGGRHVLPWDLFMARGTWYLRGWDEGRDAERTFRLDRIEHLEVTGRPFERPAGLPAPGATPDFAALPVAEVLFDADAPDLNDRDWPGAVFSPAPDGRVRATVPYAGTRWVARKVAARGGSAVVVSPPEVRAAVADVARDELGGLR